jgi:hypothetical protein
MMNDEKDWSEIRVTGSERAALMYMCGMAMAVAMQQGHAGSIDLFIRVTNAVAGEQMIAPQAVREFTGKEKA